MSKVYSERKELVFDYLNDLRDSGVTNMYGAGEYIEFEFGVDSKEARDLLIEWMKSFERKDETETESKESEDVSNDLAEDKEHDRYDYVPYHISAFTNEVYAHHTKDDKFYRVFKFTDKRVYFKDGESKKFAPFTSISHFLVKK